MIKLARSLLIVNRQTINLRFCANSKRLPELFDEAGRVRELDKTINYFTMFGIDKSFNVELPDIAQTYKNLQKQLHPDKVSDSLLLRVHNICTYTF